MQTRNKAAILNISASLVMQGISFLTIPLFTRLLGTEQYGIYAVYMSWLGVLQCLTGLGLKNAIPTGIQDFADSYGAFRRTVMGICVAAGAALLLMAAAFRKPLSSFTGFSEGTVLLLFLNAGAVSLVEIYAALCIYENRPGANFTLSVTISFLTTGASLLLLQTVSAESPAMNKIHGYAWVYAAAGFVCAALVFLRRKEKETQAQDRRHMARYSLRMGIPMVFHALSQVVLTQSDRIMMQKMGTGEEQIGIYSLFYSLSNVLYVLFVALNNAFAPLYFDALKKEDLARTGSGIGKGDGNRAAKSGRLLNHFTELFSVLTAGFILLSPEVAGLMADDSYMAGLSLLPVLACAMYFIFLSQLPIHYELYQKKTKTIAVCTCGCAVLNMILNGIFIPMRGMSGAAFATMLSYAALFSVHFLLARGTGFRLFSGSKTAALSVAAVPVSMMFFFLLQDFWYLRWATGALLGLSELLRIRRRGGIF